MAMFTYMEGFKTTFVLCAAREAACSGENCTAPPALPQDLPRQILCRLQARLSQPLPPM